MTKPQNTSSHLITYDRQGWILSGLTLIAAGLCINTIVQQWTYFTVVHYWDQWEMVKEFAKEDGHVLSLPYLLSPHGDHIILTSRLIFLVDYFVFDYTNWFPVLTITLLQLFIAWFFSGLIIGKVLNTFRVMLFIMIAAMLLSLGQWENLTIGFQTQFPLVLLFAILACHAASNYSAPERLILSPGLFLTAGYMLLSVISMGNGIGIVAPVLVVLLAQRACWKKVIAACLLFVPSAVLFISMRNTFGGSSAEELQGQLFDVARFFFAVLGCGFTGDVTKAAITGVALFSIFIWEFWILALCPWLRRQTLDGNVVVLLAVAIFVQISAVAITLGRFELGDGAATAGRYATPAFLFYTTLILAPLRASQTGNRDKKIHWLARHAFQLAAFACVFTATTTGLFGNAVSNLRARHDKLETTSYFLVSHVWADSRLKWIYPRPHTIEDALHYLEKNRLNVFSPRFGIKTFDQSRLAELTPNSEVCGFAEIRGQEDLGEAGQTAYGVLVGKDDVPNWFVAIVDSELAGSVPATYREKPLTGGAPGSFSVPINQTENSADLPIIAAFWNGSRKPCRLSGIEESTQRRFLTNAPESSASVDTHFTSILTPEVPQGSSHQLPASIPNGEDENRILYTTWQGSDARTGVLALSMDLHQLNCRDVFIPVIRGPSSSELGISASLDERLMAQSELGPLNAHQIYWWRLSGKIICENANSARRLEIRLTDNGKGWGQWAGLGDARVSQGH